MKSMFARRTINRRFLAVSVLASLFLWGCEGDTVFSPDDGIVGEDRIEVVGYAQVAVEPDIASAQVGVQTFSADAVEAVTLNNTSTEAVLTALQALGIAEEDLQTRSFLDLAPTRILRGPS